MNSVTGLEGSALRTALLDGQREVALVLLEHGASPDDETLTPEMQKDLRKWVGEALKKNKRAMAEKEKDRQMKQMAQGITAWCAHAASSVAAEGQNDGSSSAHAPLKPSRAGRNSARPPQQSR